MQKEEVFFGKFGKKMIFFIKMSFYTWIATPLARNDDDTIPRKCNLCGDLLTANDTPLRPVSFAGNKSPHLIDYYPLNCFSTLQAFLMPA